MANSHERRPHTTPLLIAVEYMILFVVWVLIAACAFMQPVW